MAESRSTYDDAFIAHVLSLLKIHNGNAKMVSKLTGVPRTTLRQWAGRAASTNAFPRKVDESTQTFADEENAKRLDAVFVMVTEPELLRSKLDKASLRDLLISGDIATRGRALLRGQPTARTESVRVSLVEPDALRSDKLRVIEGGKRTG